MGINDINEWVYKCIYRFIGYVCYIVGFLYYVTYMSIFVSAHLCYIGMLVIMRYESIFISL